MTEQYYGKVVDNELCLVYHNVDKVSSKVVDLVKDLLDDPLMHISDIQIDIKGGRPPTEQNTITVTEEIWDANGVVLDKTGEAILTIKRIIYFK